MRIAVIGAGAVGGTVGARLIQAGHDVTFVARGATLQALRASGLRLDSVDGDLHLAEVQVTDDPATIGVVDVVLVTVKSTQVAALAPTLRPLMGVETLVIPLQNGVEAGAQLAQVLGDAHVVDGLARVIAELLAPGHVKHAAVTPVLEFGPRDGMPADAPARAQLPAFATALAEAGMVGVIPEQMDYALWEKFLFIEPMGTVGAVTRVSLGEMRSIPETRALLDDCLAEVRALAVASGVPLDEAAVARTWKRYDMLPADTYASMQRDLMAGRPSEFELQTGSVVRLARALGVPTPVHAVLYAALLPATRVA
jgi:2-dehydropantoate 2-reductase